MRRSGLLVLLACASAGCFLRGDRPSTSAIVRSLAPPLPAEGLLVESVLVEQPLGDAFLDRGLWDGSLPVGGPETRALLAENGLRVAVVTGSGPQKLQKLLESDSDTVSPQRLSFNMRKEAVVPTAGPVDPCRFDLRTDLAGKAKAVEFTQARCGVLVRPELAPDGRVKLWVEPQLQHGDRRQWLRPTADATRFEKHEEVPVEKYAVLGCEALLAPDDYLLVGWDAEHGGTLGSAMFSADAGGNPRQRVLVVRARSAAPRADDLPPVTGPLHRASNASVAGSRK